MYLVSSNALGAHDFDVYAQLFSQLRAGRIATGNTDDAIYGIDLEFVPSLQLVLTAPGYTGSLDYRLRVFSTWTTDVRESLLLFHQVSTQHGLTLTRRTSLSTSGNFGYGEVDYSRSLFIFNNGNTVDANANTNTNTNANTLPGTRPNASVLRYMSFGGAIGLNHRLSRKNQLGLSATYNGTRQLTENTATATTAAGAVPIDRRPTSDNTIASTRVDTAISGRDRISNNLSAAYATFSTGRKDIPVTYTLGWSRQLGSASNFSLDGGALVLFTFREPANNPDDEWKTAVLPAVRVSFSTQPVLNTQTPWTFTVQGSFDTFVDQFVGALVPRTGVSVTATTQINERMGFEAALLATAPLYAMLGEDIGAAVTYPTTLSARSAMVFELKENISLSAGILANTGATALFESDLSFGRQELMGLVSITMILDPNHSAINE
jgi:hypothetical protein